LLILEQLFESCTLLLLAIALGTCLIQQVLLLVLAPCKFRLKQAGRRQ
jgi:hypothetical protein